MTARRPADATVRRSLPRVARGDSAAGARVLAELIRDAIMKAEAIGAGVVAGHLRMALLVAERLVMSGEAGVPVDDVASC